ncbi:MAG TPA: peptidoglycan-associated lipoprotein Pal [Candidatus Acidoferrales bacterium]|nr:peptidoglycan-associated lipoprotein Pal [Candidatus Acidoferrales bacterium]
MRKITMKQHTLKAVATVFTMSAILMLGACHKKAAPPPPPPPAPPSPTASISVSPDTIQAGQSATLSWQTSNATDVSIDGIGAVQPSGSQQVNPTDSTTYHLTAKGSGGTQDATTRLTVAPPPAATTAPPSSATEEDLFGQTVKDVYFDYDKSDLRPDQQTAIQSDAQFLNQHSNINFTVEGHCDSRGSTEYNLALGDQRASSVKSALVSAGVSANRVKTISYGKEKPFCMEENESCWQQNRRGHFVYQK